MDMARKRNEEKNIQIKQHQHLKKGCMLLLLAFSAKLTPETCSDCLCGCGCGCGCAPAPAPLFGDCVLDPVGVPGGAAVNLREDRGESLAVDVAACLPCRGVLYRVDGFIPAGAGGTGLFPPGRADDMEEEGEKSDLLFLYPKVEYESTHR